MSLARLFLWWVSLSAWLVQAVPMPQSPSASAGSSNYWVSSIQRQGTVAFGSSASYQIFRNVKDFGAKGKLNMTIHFTLGSEALIRSEQPGDGSTDDTAAINQAISSGDRCGEGCDSSTLTPALVYFPPGTYVVSEPILQYYYTQLVGDALNIPTIKAAAGFSGMAVIDADPYNTTGGNWYTNTNNFYRQIRNFVIDLTAMPQSSGAGIHWQVAQATSLQNIRFEMVQGGGDANHQQGIFMDNGSGGFMSDLIFNGGNYGMFLGNQQFTTRNLTFNNCNTAIFMNWNWAWTLKSVNVNNCGVALNMSNSPSNQTVGSVMLLDSTISTTGQAIVTAFTSDSIPVGGGTLVLDNVDFTGSKVAVADVNGDTILAGGSVVQSWVQGNTYTASSSSTGGTSNSTQKANSLDRRQEDTCPAGSEIRTIVITVTVGTPEPSSTGPNSGSTGLPTSGAVVPSSTAISQSIPTASTPASSAFSSISSISSTSSTVPSSGSPAPIPVASSSSQSSSVISASSASSGTCSLGTATPARARTQAALSQPTKPEPLLDPQGKVFERSKPQYEDVPVSSFVSVKSAGAKGDGITDDTAVIQKVLDSATSNQVVYFDHGAYLITSTIKVPKDIRITGEIWPILMASGPAFADETNPIPMLQIGQPGDSGSVELSDFVLETKGPASGAILMEWNVAAASQGSAGMWDVHFRVGGSAGTELQSNTCAKDPSSTASPKAQCIGAFMLLHVTKGASAYIENSWLWVADHELDLPDHNQIDIYNGRGVLVESQDSVWMYGTSAEHSQLYNYQVTNAKNVFMALIQTETPYYQSNPNALTPFKPQSSWSDPDFSTCTTDSCRKAWGLRVQQSSDIYIYGAGHYSFFDNYDQTCLATESCQENIVEVDCSQISLYGLSTKASTNMVTSSSGNALVLQSDNVSNFCSTIALFEQ